jgi:hypothetical protein
MPTSKKKKRPSARTSCVACGAQRRRSMGWVYGCPHNTCPNCVLTHTSCKVCSRPQVGPAGDRVHWFRVMNRFTRTVPDPTADVVRVRVYYRLLDNSIIVPIRFMVQQTGAVQTLKLTSISSCEGRSIDAVVRASISDWLMTLEDRLDWKPIRTDPGPITIFAHVTGDTPIPPVVRAVLDGAVSAFATPKKTTKRAWSWA